MVPAVASPTALSSPATLAPGLAGRATCLSCHTQHLTLSNAAVATGADWRCHRCSQSWDAGRLTAVAAYSVWISARTASAAERVVDLS